MRPALTGFYSLRRSIHWKEGEKLAEPLSTTVYTSAGVIIFGVYTGLDYATLIAGVCGGATALSYAEPTKPLRQFLVVLSAALLSGYSAPWMAPIGAAAINKIPFIEAHVTDRPLEIGLGFLIAFLAHGLILPSLLRIGKFWAQRATP